MTNYVINIATRGDHIIFVIDDVEYKIEFYTCWLLKDLVSIHDADGADLSAYATGAISRSLENPIGLSDGSIEFEVLGDDSVDRLAIPAQVAAAIVAIYMSRNQR